MLYGTMWCCEMQYSRNFRLCFLVIGINNGKSFSQLLNASVTFLISNHVTIEALIVEEAFGDKDASEEDSEKGDRNQRSRKVVKQKQSIESDRGSGEDHECEPPEAV